MFILSYEDPFLSFVHVSDNHFFRLREHLKKFGKNTQDRVSIMRGEYIIYFFSFLNYPFVYHSFSTGLDKDKFSA